MAGQMTHMEVAYRVAEKMNITTGKAEFILGSVAPDAISDSVPFWETKVHTHLFEGCGPWGDTWDYDRWLSNIDAFWNEYGAAETDIKRKMLILGICVHCLTDHWNDLLIWRKAQKMCMSPLSRDEFKVVYYPDMKKVGLWLYQNSKNTPEIFRLLATSKEMDIGDYTHSADLRNIKDHLINVQYNVTDPVDVSECKYCTTMQMLEFIDICTDKIYDRISDYKELGAAS